jgi:hypothetical protein
MRKHLLIAIALTADLCLAACGAGSGGFGSTGPAGPGPNQSGTCTEDVPDPFGNPTGITVVDHRVVASLKIACTGNVTPKAYYLNMIVVVRGQFGPGIEVTTVPTSAGRTVTVSTACTPKWSYHIWYVAKQTWPDGTVTKSGLAADGAVPLPEYTVKANGC